MVVQLYWCLVAALCLWPAIVCSERPVGAPLDIDLNKEDIQDIVNFAVGEYNKQSNDKYFYKPISVISGQKQVVSGIKYILIVKIRQTECAKNAPSGYGNGESCDVDYSNGAQEYICKFEVVVKAWLTGKDAQRLESSSCVLQ